MRSSFIITAAILAAVSLSSTPATALELEAGLVLGANSSRLSQPRDLEGEPTLLQGSRFSGFGAHVGPDVRWRAARLAFAELVIDSSILVGLQNGSGFVADPQSGARRDVDFSLINLRVPVLVGVRYGVGESAGFTLQAGAELLSGLVANSTVTEAGLSGEPDPLDVATATHVGLTLGVSFDYALNDNIIVPLSLRYVYDPMVPKKTVERFDGYQSQDDPGAFTVAFDHVILLSLGARFDL